MSYVLENPLFENSSNSDKIEDLFVLLEAEGDDSKYSLDAPTDTPQDDNKTNDNIDDQGDDSKYSLDDGTGEDANNDTQPDNPDDNTDDTAVSGDVENDTGDVDTTDDASMDDTTPQSNEIKILNLSEKDKQLNNLKLSRKFSVLINDIQVTIDNLISRPTYSQKQTQVIDKCMENLNDMVEDVKTYMTIKFSDTYETNVTAYLTFLKRFKTVLALIRVSNDLR